MAINFYSDVHLNANKLGRDADNLLDFSTDNEITFRVGAGDGVVFKASGEIEATKFDGALEGNADTATALATTRAFQTNLASTSSANFDGSAANTHGVTGTLAVGNGGTGVTSMTNLKNALDDETWTFANNITLAGFVLDGNTITGVDDSLEFTDNDNHIMTSAGINDTFAVIGDTTGVDDYQSTDFQDQSGMTTGHGRTLKYSPGSSTSLTAGRIYFLNTSGIWTETDAETVGKGATQLLCVGIGANPQTVGVFMEGFIQIPSSEILNTPGSGAVDGLPLYVSDTDGHFDFTAPSGSGDYVRIVGYAVDDFTEESNTDVLVYFCPSKDHIVLA